MTTSVFLDSNILIYAYSPDPRVVQARQVMRGDYVIGVQTLNEFSYVARRKLKLSWDVIRAASQEMSESAEMVVPTFSVDHQLSFNLAERHQLSLFDALMLAIALRAGCTTFYSEDMQHGFIVEDRMTVLNPFA